ncbi:MAG: hypothetical protein ABUS51_02600 [Acidobacteriota bacterium]
MPLFADGPAGTVDDLTDQDSGLPDVAKTCGINVTTKIRLAHEEIGSDLRLWLDRPRPSLDLVWAPALRIEQVVVTPPLKRWETMMALSLVYRDAYFSQLVDRYQAKWEEYSQLTRRAYDRFVASGMGFVNDPVRRAAPPALATVAGPQKGGAFYASVAWVNGRGQEGAVSTASSITIADGHLMTVTGVDAPVGVSGFNVYAGPDLNAMFLQTSVALPAGLSFTYVPGAATHGRLPGTGQAPDFVRPLVRTLLRG